MSYQFEFQKLLAIREREKDKVLVDYNESVKNFEALAEKLYSYLKRKEELEEKKVSKLSTGLKIQDIRHQQQFITNLEKTIAYYQRLVMDSRQKMQQFQAILLEKNIEVKKFEKMKEKRLQAFVAELNHQESKLMDEISIQQFMGKGN
jgi:flagellar protein FliJ